MGRGRMADDPSPSRLPTLDPDRKGPTVTRRMRRRRAIPPMTAPAAERELVPDVELVVVSADQEQSLDGSVRRLHAHLAAGGQGPTDGLLLTIADHASTDRTGALADALAAELDASGPIPVRAVHLLERLERGALRQRWASSSSRVAAFVTLRPDTDLPRVLAPLEGRLRRPDLPARPGVLSRRHALGALGGAGLVLLAACSGRSSTGSGPTSSTSGSGSTASTAATTSTSAAAGAATTTSTAAATATPVTTPTNVTLAPEMTEGPYYLDLDLVRSDVREDRGGATLNLDFIVMDVARQAPVGGAAVDIWHCDAEGIYSGFVAASTGGNGGGPGGGPSGVGSGADDSTFLRGTQLTGSDGKVSFTTVYPGWYQGRTVHIHVKVHVGGKEIHTGQLFFDDEFTDAVYASTSPYSSRGERSTRNDDDSIFGDGGDASTLAVTRSADAYTATMAVGIST
jgi:protocatechuate 3,4-dioxygenase beta subunit